MGVILELPYAIEEMEYWVRIRLMQLKELTAEIPIVLMADVKHLYKRRYFLIVIGDASY